MVVIGLTGGIASGKSTVSSVLRELGAEIVDADLIGREIVKRGSPAWNAIRREFGDGILRPDGSIDRPKLGALVFSNRAALRKLNELTHPDIRRVVRERIAAASQRPGGPPPAVVVDAAVLFEAGIDSLVDVVWLVEVDPETQAKRLMARDGFSPETARARISAQAAFKKSTEKPVVVIDNTGSVEDLERRVRGLWFSTVPGEGGEVRPR
ncbi:MAG: dephospho-CoA kinase [Firmicutes bacterium]|jgi:dephospho-CoA kinase|nr:dephospho-CoA kinase [Bacillota bacterium]